jgi:uncharacterized membrane protein YbhN (UPF0104 family)
MSSPARTLHARLSSHRWAVTVVAVALEAVAALLVAWWAGWSAVRKALSDAHPGWVLVIILLTPVAVGGYAIAYRAVARLDHGPTVPLRAAMRVVTAGFGPFVVAGGFAADQRFLTGAGTPERHARVLVLGLAALEYAVLAPAACACAVILLVTGAPAVQPGLLWSWAIAVPIGFAVGFWRAAHQHRERVKWAWLRDCLDAVALLGDLARDPIRHAAAWIGMAVYWSAEIAMLDAGLRLFGTTLDAAHVAIAYATGYALTRRSMPLGGAGATIVLMSLAVHWVGVPLASALPPVVAYRIANFLLPALPAIRSHRRVEALHPEPIN